jgi:hypothetical protein
MPVKERPEAQKRMSSGHTGFEGLRDDTSPRLVALMHDSATPIRLPGLTAWPAHQFGLSYRVTGHLFIGRPSYIYINRYELEGNVNEIRWPAYDECRSARVEAWANLGLRTADVTQAASLTMTSPRPLWRCLAFLFLH